MFWVSVDFWGLRLLETKIKREKAAVITVGDANFSEMQL